MKILYYEMRKLFFRKYMLCLFVLALLLNALFIYGGYRYGGGGFTDEITPYTVSRAQWKYYKKLHNKLDGTLSEDTVNYITEKYKEYKALIDSGQYSTEYDPATETGYIFGDYSIIAEYFYQPMKYIACYQLRNQEFVKELKEKKELYHQRHNLYGEQKTAYMIKCFANRNSGKFYSTQGWEKLFAYDDSDLFCFMLLLMVLLSVYRVENKGSMEEIILVSPKCMSVYGRTKAVTVGLLAAFLSLSFSVCSYLTFGATYGLLGTDMMLYSIQDYQYTPLNVSVFEFYLLLCIMKCVGMLFSAWFLLFFCRKIKNIYLLYIVLLLFFVAALYASGFVCSSNPAHYFGALLSPLSALKINEVFSGCYGAKIGERFFGWLPVYLCFQTLLCVMFRLFDWKNMKKRGKDHACMGM